MQEFFELLGERKDSIRAVSLDTPESYAGAIRRSLPNAQITFDPFHVIALAGVAVDQVHPQHSHTMGGHLKAGQVWIKHARWALLKAPEKLNHRQQLALAQIQPTNRPLYRAYLLKEQLRALYQLTNPRRRARPPRRPARLGIALQTQNHHPTPEMSDSNERSTSSSCGWISRSAAPDYVGSRK